jgi:hypothetical protein
MIVRLAKKTVHEFDVGQEYELGVIAISDGVG